MRARPLREIHEGGTHTFTREPEPCEICGHPEHRGFHCRGPEDDGCACEVTRYHREGP